MADKPFGKHPQSRGYVGLTPSRKVNLNDYKTDMIQWWREGRNRNDGLQKVNDNLRRHHSVSISRMTIRRQLEQWEVIYEKPARANSVGKLRGRRNLEEFRKQILEWDKAGILPFHMVELMKKWHQVTTEPSRIIHHLKTWTGQRQLESWRPIHHHPPGNILPHFPVAVDLLPAGQLETLKTCIADTYSNESETAWDLQHN